MPVWRFLHLVESFVLSFAADESAAARLQALIELEPVDPLVRVGKAAPARPGRVPSGGPVRRGPMRLADAKKIAADAEQFDREMAGG